MKAIPKPVAAGAILSLMSILFGFSLGGGFGAAEDAFKSRLAESGNAVLETVYKGDAAAKDAVVKKSWDYLIRAHLHAGAIGTASLASIATMILLCPLTGIAQLSAVAFGAGALIYSGFWLMAGFMAPGLGSTGAAKKALEVVAVPGAGLCLIGAFGTLFCVAKASFFPPKS